MSNTTSLKLIELNRGTVLHFMKQVLSHFEPTTLYYERYVLMNATLSGMATAQIELGLSPGASDPFQRLAWGSRLSMLLEESYQQLMALGYIIPKPDPPNLPNYNRLLLTDLGREWASSSDPIPEDIGGYLVALDALVPRLDPQVRQFVDEALRCYERRLFLAAAVMVGAASEKSIHLVMESLLKAVKSRADRGNIREAVDLGRLPTMFKYLSQYMDQAKKLKRSPMPYAVHEGCDRHLLSLQEAIRVQRNGAVHARTEVSPGTVRLTLAAFPHACHKLYDLIGWFDSHRV